MYWASSASPSSASGSSCACSTWAMSCLKSFSLSVKLDVIGVRCDIVSAAVRVKAKGGGGGGGGGAMDEMRVGTGSCQTDGDGRQRGIGNEVAMDEMDESERVSL